MKLTDTLSSRRSSREKRKVIKEIIEYSTENKSTRKTTVYNDQGIHVKTGLDLCDCLDKNCPGCHFPCPSCSSCKCGHKCRVNREWSYSSFIVHGKD